MYSDDNLLDFYKNGFNDELNGKTKNTFKDALEKKAYTIGCLDALVGDDVSSVDHKTEKEILEQIKAK